jgi:hypothetical protein
MEFELREYLFCLEVDFDIDAQLAAIRELLRQNADAKQVSADEMARIASDARAMSGARSEMATDAWIDRAHHSVYQGAAHSLAAVGMFPPLTETLFFQYYQAIGAKFFPTSAQLPSHDRWKSAHASQWDCHYVFGGKGRVKDIAGGIMQLSDAVGLGARLPTNLKKFLRLLFRYRNEMFHHGFEWPVDVRERFARMLVEEDYPERWIEKATSGGQPWIFYLSDTFITEYLTIMDEVLDALAMFIRDELPPTVGKG